jgi:CO/xanthine dehydrogenase Mo-binding subunit
MGVARDNYGRDGSSKSYVAGFAEVEVDIETGAYQVLEFVTVADVGTVIHPRSLGGQINGGVMMGLGHAMTHKWVYDQQYGAPVARRFYQTKPLTILDAPAGMRWEALDIPDPETPVGARGVGEAPVGAGFGAVVNAIASAIGDDLFHRAPVTPDMILTALEEGRATHDPLAANV